jgi:hypothetical protein
VIDQVRAWAKQHDLEVSFVLEHWAERAAIREFEGRQSRQDAEVGAFDDVRSWYGPALPDGSRE